MIRLIRPVINEKLNREYRFDALTCRWGLLSWGLIFLQPLLLVGLSFVVGSPRLDHASQLRAEERGTIDISLVQDDRLAQNDTQASSQGKSSSKSKSSRTTKVAPKGDTLVTVNGVPITTATVELWMIRHHIPESQRQRLQSQAIDLLIDEELLRDFLSSRKIEVPEVDVERATQRWNELVQLEKQEPQELRERLGYSEDQLREILSLPSAWRVYANLIITPQKISDYFIEHQEQFDGTRVRASQILMKLPENATDDDVKRKTAELSALKREIEAGKTTFADAAREHSNAPSKEQGGDIGFFTYQGTMPSAIIEAAFRIKPGEISEPVRSPFGLHLVTVTEKQAGQLTLEDARPLLLDELSRSLWNETARRLREKANIERIAPRVKSTATEKTKTIE